MTSIYNHIYGYLITLPFTDLIEIHNLYCACINSFSDTINEITDDIFNNENKLDLLKRAYDGDFNPYDSYFFTDGYNNLVSFSDINDDNCNIDIDTIVKYIIDNDDDLCDYGIRTILNTFK